MAEKRSVQDNLVEYGKTVATLITGVVLMAHKDIRPHIINAFKVASSWGMRGGRFVAHLLDRSLVSAILRPVLLWGTVTIALVELIGAIIAAHLVPLAGLGEPGVWMFLVSLLGLGLPMLMWLATRDVRHYSDREGLRIREGFERTALGNLIQHVNPQGVIVQPIEAVHQMIRLALDASIQRVQGLRQQTPPPVGNDDVISAEAHAQTVLSGMDTLMRSLRREAREGTIVKARDLADKFFAAAEKALEENDAAMIRAQQAQILNQPLLQTLPMLRNGFLTLQGEAEALQQNIRPMQEVLRNQLATAVRDRFGRAGLALPVTLVILLEWLAAFGVSLAMALVLRQWHASELPDIRLSGIFVGFASFFACGLFILLVAAVGGIEVVLRYGVGLLVWGTKMVVRPLVEAASPEVDHENIAAEIPDDLGVPYQHWADSLGRVLKVPSEVCAGLLALLIAEHDLAMVCFVGGLAVLLLSVWKFAGLGDVKLASAVKAFVVILIIVAIYMFLRRSMGYSVYGDVDWAMAQWGLFTGAELMPVAVVGAVALFMGLQIYKKAPHKMVQHTGLYIGAIIALICLVMSVGIFLGYNQRPDSQYGHTGATTSAPTASHAEAEDPRPTRSASTAESHGG